MTAAKKASNIGSYRVDDLLAIGSATLLTSSDLLPFYIGTAVRNN